MRHPTICAVAAALLAAFPGAQAGMYTKKSPVLQVEAKDYDRLIAKSNYTSVVEFYAPWCGHCQNLKPAYEKAAKNLEGLAKVAAVNCDDDANKPFCGSMGVQGFPTLKIVKPTKGGGKPVVEDYQGPRTATGIVDAVVQRINNHVKKIEDKNVDDFLSEKNETAKAILFTEKGTTSALIKSIAIDFLDVITVGQVRNKEAKTVEMFGVETFPALVLLPGGDADALVYDGEINKADMVTFLSQAGAPNPDPAPLKAKNNNKSSASASSKVKSKETSSETTSARSETATQEAPVIVETALPIPAINTHEKLVKECLTEKSHTCVLALVPSDPTAQSQQALAALSELAFKHAQSKRHLFPFFEVPRDSAAALIEALDLRGEVEIVAVNARRGWWRRYVVGDADEFGHESIERWVDAIRLSEGVKQKLPEGLVVTVAPENSEQPKHPRPEAVSSEAATPDATEEVSSEAATPLTPEAIEDTNVEDAVTESTSTKGADPTLEPETAAEEPVVHEEL